ncbi:hypothetical protein A0H76_2185 [Hepatospora eriocheir]|uniref:Man1/Src1 C-terminal domain-containing protein n=1 Tax=Hepatospora eriocheir TaxID=1081669 RepID=A0A1X0QLF2_9MICR|nr:hypothetical protein A0H76_2185 [Hepatospora eriocheir]
MNRKKYLDKYFDYKSLTKIQLRDVLSQFNIPNIPPLSAKKSVILRFYEENIYNRIEHLKELDSTNFSNQNIFQSSVTNSPVKSSLNNLNNTSLDNINSSFVQSDNSFISNLNSENFYIKGDDIRETSKIKIDNDKEEIKTKTLDSFFNSVQNNSKIELGEELNEKSNEEIKNKSSFNEEIHSNNDVNRRSLFFSIIFRMIKVIFKLFKYTFYLLILSSIGLVIYMKFFLPYCDGTRKWCIFLPKHGLLVNGKLKCAKNFKKVTSIIDHCVFDQSIILAKKFRVDSIIRKLNYIRGEYEYGYRSTPRVPVERLETDSEIIEMIKNSNLVIFTNNYTVVESIMTKVSFKILLRYGITIFLKYAITIMVIISICVYFFILTRSRIKSSREAEKLLPPILESLRRQIMTAIKTPVVYEYVYSKQLKQAFQCNDEIWTYVERKLIKNVNVETKQENNDLCFKWVGPIYFESK